MPGDLLEQTQMSYTLCKCQLISTLYHVSSLWTTVLMATSRVLIYGSYICRLHACLHVWCTRAHVDADISETAECSHCSQAKIGTVKVSDRDSKDYRDWPDPKCNCFVRKKVQPMACKCLESGWSASHSNLAKHHFWSTLTRDHVSLPSTRHAHARRLNEVQIRTNGLTSIAVTTHKLSLLTLLVFEEHALLPIVMFW